MATKTSAITGAPTDVSTTILAILATTVSPIGALPKTTFRSMSPSPCSSETSTIPPPVSISFPITAVSRAANFTCSCPTLSTRPIEATIAISAATTTTAAYASAATSTSTSTSASTTAAVSATAATATAASIDHTTITRTRPGCHLDRETTGTEAETNQERAARKARCSETQKAEQR
jgi:hypothetical protein